jgi:lipopolysaccharide heptosyltransferase I
MSFTDYIKNYFEFLVFWVLKIIFPKPKLIKNSLLFINTGLIGDLVVSSILLENPNILNAYSQIGFVIREQYLELFNNYDGRVEFIGYNYKKYKSSIRYKYKFLSLIRMKGFRKCVHLTAARGILNEEMTHLIGAKEVIALNSIWEYLGPKLGKYYDNKYDRIIAKNTLNEYEKHFELMRHLGGNDSKLVFNNGITFNEEDNSSNKKFKDCKEAIVIAPFSSLMNRDWKKEYYSEIVKRLKEKYKIILLGSKSQKKDLEELCHEDVNVKILAGELNLYEIPLLLKRAKFYIGLDSGITHMALKVGIPLIAIIGGGEFGRFFPYKESKNVKYLYYKMDCFLCHWKCRKKEMFCMTEITVDDVILGVENRLLDH